MTAILPYFGYWRSDGNNWIDYLGERRFRDASSFPGAEINRLGGKIFYKSLFELQLPALHLSCRVVPIPIVHRLELRPVNGDAGIVQQTQ